MISFTSIPIKYKKFCKHQIRINALLNNSTHRTCIHRRSIHKHKRFIHKFLSISNRKIKIGNKLKRHNRRKKSLHYFTCLCKTRWFSVKRENTRTWVRIDPYKKKNIVNNISIVFSKINRWGKKEMKEKLFRKEKGEMRKMIYIKNTIHPLVHNFYFCMINSKSEKEPGTVQIDR